MTTSILPILPIADLDASWVTAALREAGRLPSGRVTTVRSSPCGTGQMADTYRLALDYDAAGAGPASVVVKVTSEDPVSRAFGQETGFYKTEVRFYEDLAARLPVSTPRPIHSRLAENETDFVLVLDDLAPARSVDQLVGCTVDEAALVVEQAAALHAGSWNDRELAGQSWLRSIVETFVGATDAFPTIASTFRELYGDVVAAEDIAEAETLIGLGDAWKRVLGEPRCLWHSDFRVDNMLFDAHDGAMPVAILDWQTIGMGNGVIDLSYFLGGSITTKDRRANERDLVAHYHEALVSHGVERYSLEECWDDYRLLSIYGLQTGVFGAVRVKRTPRGDDMWRMWIERHASQTRDHESFALLAAG